MIEVSTRPDSNIVELAFDGAITAAEFDTALTQLAAAIEQHGKIKLLERIGELGTPPIPWSKFWEDAKFGFQHLRDITHVAVVAEQGWIAAWVKFLNPLLKADVEMYWPHELALARAWLEKV